VVIEAQIPFLETLLTPWQQKVGDDYLGYKNHVYRVVHFCFALHRCTEAERAKIIIAGCFHDLGIWTSNTFDYLPPSVALANAYLKQTNREAWADEVELMIALHHKLRAYRDPRYPLVEVFRQGDLVDFSLGIVRCGVPAPYIAAVKQRFPNAGFHKRLVQLELSWLSKHPLNPLPVFKW
jgi:hypothetical protein